MLIFKIAILRCGVVYPSDKLIPNRNEVSILFLCSENAKKGDNINIFYKIPLTSATKEKIKLACDSEKYHSVDKVSSLEAAHLLGVNKAWVKVLLRSKRIQAEKIGNFWAIDIAQLIKFAMLPRKRGPKPKKKVEKKTLCKKHYTKCQKSF